VKTRTTLHALVRIVGATALTKMITVPVTPWPGSPLDVQEMKALQFAVFPKVPVPPLEVTAKTKIPLVPMGICLQLVWIARKDSFKNAVFRLSKNKFVT